MPRASRSRSILAEPEFDLIEPRRVGRREMQMHLRMRDRETCAPRGSCAWRGCRGSHESRARAVGWRRCRPETRQRPRSCAVARSAPSTSPVCVFERGKQRQGAVAVVFEAMSLGAPRRQRQHWVEPIEGLNRRLFVDGEDRRMLRRIQIQPDHVGRFGLEVADRPTACSARSDAASARPASTPSAHGCGESSAAGRVCGSSSAYCHRSAAAASSRECAPRARREHRRLSGPGAAIAAVQPVGHEPPPPAIDVVPVAPERRPRSSSTTRRRPTSESPSPVGILGSNDPARRASLQFRPFILVNVSAMRRSVPVPELVSTSTECASAPRRIL